MQQTQSTKQQLARMAEETPEMKAAAKAYAERVAIKQTVLVKLYRPLGRMVGISKSYFESEFATDMADKLQGIPDDALMAPRASVAVPAMEALGYSLDEPQLKEMYLNLLATATDARVAETAHPSFAEIIRQLEGSEAQLFSALLSARNAYVPIVELRLETAGDAGWSVRATHLMNMTRDNATVKVESLPVWVDNWIRLGLVEVDYATFMTDEAVYEWVDEHPTFRAAEGEVADYMTARTGESEGPGSRQLKVARGIMRITNFGSRFATAVGI